MTFPYQVVVQWSQSRKVYEAYAPTLVHHCRTFDPKNQFIGYSTDPAEALTNYILQAKGYFSRLRDLAILPPPTDVGCARGQDPETVEYDEETCYGGSLL